MKKLLIALFVASLSTMAEGEIGIQGTHCGTRGNLWGTIASELVIPDYFPPENMLLRLFLANPLFIDLSICEEEYAPVHLGQSCQMHDQCYATLGSVKDSCDTQLLEGWRQGCAERYEESHDTSSYCRSACEGAVELMHAAMQYDDGYFCPSCLAFERAQERARRR